MEIKLTEKELLDCRDFSEKCAKGQQKIEFGQPDTSERSDGETSRDIYIGKIAEVAFKKMMEEKYNTDVQLDFECYDGYDDKDADVNGWRIDVKATRQGGKWLLFEWNKLNFRQENKQLPDLIVMASVGWDRDEDIPTGSVKLEGCIQTVNLYDGAPNVVVLKKGSTLPNTKNGVKLQADNFGVLFDNLERDWDKSIKFILENKPASLADYPNPYDKNKTYRTLFPEDYK